MSIYLIKLESEQCITDIRVWNKLFFFSVRTSSLNPNWLALMMSIGLILSVKNYIKQQLEECWVHNIQIPFQRMISTVMPGTRFITHTEKLTFHLFMSYISCQTSAVFSCLLPFVGKSCASVLHEHHLQTSTGCKRSLWAVVSKVPCLLETLADLSEIYGSFPRVPTVLPRTLGRSSCSARSQIFR